MNWLDSFTPEQRHAHSLQSIALRNRRIRRVSSSQFGQLDGGTVNAPDNVVRLEASLERSLERLSREIDRVMRERQVLLDACDKALTSAQVALACGQPIDARLLERLMARAIREATR